MSTASAALATRTVHKADRRKCLAERKVAKAKHAEVKICKSNRLREHGFESKRDLRFDIKEVLYDYFDYYNEVDDEDSERFAGAILQNVLRKAKECVVMNNWPVVQEMSWRRYCPEEYEMIERAGGELCYEMNEYTPGPYELRENVDDDWWHLESVEPADEDLIRKTVTKLIVDKRLRLFDFEIQDPWEVEFDEVSTSMAAKRARYDDCLELDVDFGRITLYYTV